VTAATLTGLLGDEDRLRVVAAIALGARTIDDVARTGGLAPGEVRRALPRLIAAGVVEEWAARRPRPVSRRCSRPASEAS